MKILKNTYLYLITVIMAMATLTACVDDDLDISGGENPGEDIDPYNLTFNISLESMQSRASLGGDNFEDYEDLITTSQVYILFFTKDNQLIKKFSFNELSMIPVRNTNNETTKNWSVRIPISTMAHGEAFAEQLRKAPFKIAVLANWSKAPVITEAAYVEGVGFDVEHSDNIDVLHHQTDSGDPYSDGDPDDDDNEGKKNDTYGFLYKNYIGKGKYMGYYTNWVKSNSTELNSRVNARNWIRSHWDPSISKNHRDASQNDGGVYQYGSYTDLWFLWNFGGNASDNAIPYGTSDPDYDNTFKKEWETRNGAKLRNWIGTTDGADLADLARDSNGEDRNYLGFKNFSGDVKATAIYRADGSNHIYGVFLPRIANKGYKKENNVESYTRVGDSNGGDDEGAFIFTARATGTLFITAKATGPLNGSTNTSTAKITAQIGYTTNTEDFTFKQDGQIHTESKKISITGDEQPIYLFNNSSNTNNGDVNNYNNVEIYQIEYIQDEYIYGADRSGVKPSPQQPIEMYGIQSFGALEGFWAKGTSFDLSNYDKTGPSGYDSYYKTIQILRSVAKIELKIPASLDPGYVYLRCVNRKSRWLPMDIASNTSDIWADYVGTSAAHPAACEYFEIKKQQPFFTGNVGNYSAAQQLTNYQQKLAWYFGAWSGDNGSFVGDVSIDATSKSKVAQFPRVMNAVIERSDFVEFIPAPADDPIYNRYVLYVGEKYVDDPNDVGESTNADKGMEASKPKVCHIEFRVDSNTADHTNLDDNKCVRIYFIEGGVKAGYTLPTFQTSSRQNFKGETVDDDWEHTYEQDPSILQGHWPIIRNHVYSFTVTDVKNLMAVIELKVLPWRIVEAADNTYDW